MSEMWFEVLCEVCIGMMLMCVTGCFIYAVPILTRILVEDKKSDWEFKQMMREPFKSEKSLEKNEINQ